VDRKAISGLFEQTVYFLYKHKEFVGVLLYCRKDSPATTG
jgi:hypothetical protein